MLKETARVLAVDEDGVWVEARRKSHCHGCSATAVCGHGLLERRRGQAGLLKARALDRALLQQVRVGDQVTLGVADTLILKLSLVFYLMPLAGLAGASLLANRFGAGEFVTGLCGLLGLLMGFSAPRLLTRRADDPGDHAVLLGLEARPEEREGLIARQ